MIVAPLRTLFAICLCAGVGAAWASALPPEVALALRRQAIAETAVSLYLQGVDAPRPALAFNADTPRNPASVMKVVTTLAALDLLGPAYAWHTEAYAAGDLRDGRLDGDLVFKGNGDPYFTTERFWQLLRELRERGLRDIQGDLLVDGSRFDDPRGDPGDFDGKPNRAYNALPHALSLNFQAVQLTLAGDPAAGKVRAFTDPPLANLVIDNRLRPLPGTCGATGQSPVIQAQQRPAGSTLTITGSLAVSCPDQVHAYRLLEPIAQLGGAFRALWGESGGTLRGTVRSGVTPAGARLLYTQESRPLDEAVRGINKYSNNLMARMLLLTLGAERLGSPGTPAKGREVVAAWLRQQGLDPDGLYLDNGSGLSRDGRISAETLGRLLVAAYRGPHMPPFLASLPVAGVDGTMARRLRDRPVSGHAYIKTGTIDDVSAMAGYVQDHAGRRWAVVLIVNQKGLAARQGRAAQDAVLEWVFAGAR